MATRRSCVAMLLLILTAGACWAKTYTVTKAGDSGKGTLRWAIDNANTRPSDDTIIFDPALSGETIRPLTNLPVLSDPGTVIDGDINGDGTPDIELRVSRVGGGGIGLKITQATKNGCIIRGLSITDWETRGLDIWISDYNEVYGCSFGVRLDGTTLARNGLEDIRAFSARHNRIGKPGAVNRNVIAGGGEAAGDGVELASASDKNKIHGNYFGIRRDGSAALDPTYYAFRGVYLSGSCQDNEVGGSDPDQGNVFTGWDTAAYVSGSQTSRNTIKGNYFGFLPDGDTAAPIIWNCIRLTGGAHDNTIGGTAAGARNLFCGSTAAPDGPCLGIRIDSAGTEDNVIKGNHFGLNAAGTETRPLPECIRIYNGAGPQTIGGSPSGGGGNVFCPNMPTGATKGVNISGSGNGIGTVIRGNTFGELPDGTLSPSINFGVAATNTEIEVLDNEVAGCNYGLWVYGADADVTVQGNDFKRCQYAVITQNDGSCFLGNLSDGDSTNDGGNIFRLTNTWTIHNGASTKIKAEGNRFITTVASEIEASIYDKRDNPSMGRIDYDPLKGGVAPSGGTVGVAGLVAVPTAVGAHITFTLAADAAVTARVLNIAGRPVKTLCAARDSQTGANTLVWNASTDAGLTAPAGRYLVEVQARGADGQSARSVVAVQIQR